MKNTKIFIALTLSAVLIISRCNTITSEETVKTAV